MIVVEAEHSFDADLLKVGSKVLDIGCRGFLFSKAMYERKCHVFAIDIDVLPAGNMNYMRCAVSDFDGLCGITTSDDPQATKINKLGTGTDCYTLKSLSQKFQIDFWDLIKIDVEGSEYEIIMSLDAPPAKQLSIEFHLHTGAYKSFEMNAMENKLKALGYEFAKHEYKSDHGAGFNYWDSLFILR